MNIALFRTNITHKLHSKIYGTGGPLNKCAVNLERGIYNSALKEADRSRIVKKWTNKQFMLLYVNRLRSVMMNLSGNILEGIRTHAIVASDVAFMTHQELAPERWAALIDAKTKRDKNKFETNIAAATDIFTCRKCKQKQCTYYQMQTRSADEPMTVYVSCCLCGNRWKTS
jgi:transcription elongation factor S-II